MDQNKTLEAVIAAPLSSVRIQLSEYFMRKEISARELLAVFDDITKANTYTIPQNLENTIKLARYVLTNGSFSQKKGFEAPSLKTPEEQMVWGAAMVYLAANKEATAKWPKELQTDSLEDTALWKALANARRSNAELAANASHVFESVRNREVRMGWGTPGSWFYYNPEQNYINLDLTASLIAGFEHIRSVFMHEIGHSQLTIEYPQRLKDLNAEIAQRTKAMDEARARGEKITKEAYIELFRLNTKGKLMMELFNPCEDNCVNRYAADMENVLPQAYSVSTNHTYVTTSGFGTVMKYKRSIPEDATEAEQEFHNLTHTVSTSFYRNNDLFVPDDEGWKKMYVNKEMLKPNVRDDEGNLLGPDAALYRLMQLAGQFEVLKPGLEEYVYGKKNFDKKARQLSQRRGDIMGQIWDEYAAAIAEKIIDERAEDLDKFIEEIKKALRDGLPMPGDSASAGPGKYGMGEGNTPSVSVDGAEMPGMSMPNENPQEGKKPGEGTGEGQWGKSDDKAGKDPSKDDKGHGGEDKDGEKKDGDKKGGEKKDNENQSKGQTLDKLMEQHAQGEHVRDIENAGQKNDNSDPSKDAEAGKQRQSTNRAGHGDGTGKYSSKPRSNVDKVRQKYDYNYADDKGEDSPYKRLVGDLSNDILPTTQAFRRIIDKLKYTQVDEGRELLILGELERFDPEAHKAMLIKRYTGQLVGEDDLRRFRDDDVKKMNNPKPRLVIMIDHSGSMYHFNSQNTRETKLELAQNAAVIAREAAKNAGFDTDMYTFGSATPKLIMSSRWEESVNAQGFTGAINKLVQGVREGTKIGCGNEGCPQCRVPQERLAPAVKRLATDFGKQKPDTSKPSDDVFVLVISDGDIIDDDAAKQAVEALGLAAKNIHMDGLVIGPSAGITSLGGIISHANSNVRPNMGGIAKVTKTEDMADMFRTLYTERLAKVEPPEKPRLGSAEFIRNMKNAAGRMK